MKRKPRVLIDSFLLVQALTGIRTYTTQLCKGLEALEQDEVEYIIYPNWRWLNNTTFLRGKVNAFKKILNHVLYFGWKQLYLPLLILFKRVDLIVALDYLLPYVKFGTNGLTVVHDTFYWELKGAYNPLWRKYFLKSVQMGLSSQTGLVVTSKYIAQRVREHVSDRHPISVVYQAPKDLTFTETADLSMLGIPAGTQYLLHIGIFEERKNLSVLVRAFAQLKKEAFYQDFYLVLAGSRAVGVFHDDYKQLTKLIKELDLQDQVIMPGFVPNENLGDLYKQAFAYIFPSNEEGFGIPVLEAMKSGIPVITSNQPALLEVGGEGVLSFQQDDEYDLLKKLISLENEAKRQELIQKGEKRGAEFSQSAFISQFHQAVLKQLGS